MEEEKVRIWRESKIILLKWCKPCQMVTEWREDYTPHSMTYKQTLCVRCTELADNPIDPDACTCICGGRTSGDGGRLLIPCSCCDKNAYSNSRVCPVHKGADNEHAETNR